MKKIRAAVVGYGNISYVAMAQRTSPQNSLDMTL